ncbi:MAG: bifunctional methylenetetrahydrofolate dehydrogenase/methenyltetrahydrofolate cyclohydrolase [Clostridiales bacterium]|uniref:tetrahydrofolate dehydrogenase/cyclohydrolase catalytic domain-containing protein n=1 Tax=Clostridium sp. N3C TaxID=1776758 RepID=UPI00092E1D70|nr:tetrahydrofolate dehydrogenase/cyclohydrolase catalytic domain-containing protein [Clostridium sp. N3C]NLZ47369.1 bifunctional methylenetetrahydrofolate dehydrogenase/methenyltetrahydrofolate cyclohydrolase [Clostridiales bacterium]SCN21382.1 Bifunctional protein FolD protein [Clostridium sp. N3C]
MGVSINGKAVAATYKERIKAFTDSLLKEGKRIPCIAAIIVGEDGGSHYYLNNVKKLCSELGVHVEVHIKKESIEEEELCTQITKLNNDGNVDGIMLFLPLPKHIDEKKVTSLISYKKDIDCLTDINNGKFYKGEASFAPCTPLSVINLIKSTGIDLTGKRAVVIGRSNIVGKPTAQLLLNENCTVTICHSKTINLKEICREADILISAIGRPGFINEEFVKKGAIVIDVGTSSVNEKITGDVQYDNVIEKAAFVTPVPGGVGSLTTTMLINNVCEAYKRNVY